MFKQDKRTSAICIAHFWFDKMGKDLYEAVGNLVAEEGMSQGDTDSATLVRWKSYIDNFIELRECTDTREDAKAWIDDIVAKMKRISYASSVITHECQLATFIRSLLVLNARTNIQKLLG